MPAACAIELIHTYSLIHDDLPAMDDDTMRRGRPTLHVVAGEGMAILAGDGLLTEAFALLARAPAATDPTIVARKLRVIGVIAARRRRDRHGRRPGARPRVTATTSTRDAPARHALEEDRRPDPRRRRRRARSWAARTTRSSSALTPRRPTSAWHSRSSTTSSTWKGQSAELGKTAGKDAAAGKPTYPALYGIERRASDGRRLPAAGASGAECRRPGGVAPDGHRPMDCRQVQLTD